MNSLARQLGFLILLNLAFSFGPSQISLGGHLGGLVGGLLCALAIVAGERGMLRAQRRWVEFAAMLAIAAVAVAGALAVA